MTLAGHFPTMHFTQAEWLAMGVYEAGCGDYVEGFHRTRDSRGRPLVFYSPRFIGDDDEQPHFIVRPIVRVPMGRAE